MSRLVNVSNRVALPGSRADGGLAVGLLAAMRASGGLWFGWNGAAAEDDAALPTLQRRDNVCFATIPLPDILLGPYYNGFANGTLWPLFHYFLDRFRYGRRVRGIPAGQHRVCQLAAAAAAAGRYCLGT